MGRQAADHAFARDQANGFCTFPYVRVVLKQTFRLPNAVPGVDKSLDKGDYRLLVQGGGVLVLFRPNPQDAPIKPRRPSLVIPVGEITLLELTPVAPWCGPG